MKSKRTKALEISPEVKRRVYERDNGLCILCGRPGNPEAHFISRSHGGLGIEENIVTLCRGCHRRFDQTTDRELLWDTIADYLKAHYDDWEIGNLIYRK
jgi:5-methylcytosine-specific restriction endonuclease McrA